jgi:chemotaxis protein histidine kinase CheA
MNTTIEQRRGELSSAVRRYVEELAAAATAGNLKSVFDRAHDIRGLAGTGGLEAAGKIADGLCKYLDAVERLGAAAETPIIALHIDAIARAAGTSADAQKHGPQVAAELGALVERKINAINDSRTKAAGGR